MIRLFITFIFFGVIAAPIMAQEPKGADPIKAPVELSNKAKKKTQQLQDMRIALEKDVMALRAGLNEEDARHFMTVYNSHNILQTVDIVREDVGNAVKSCAENNKDETELNEKMSQRYEDWNKKVGGAVNDARVQLVQMIAQQKYAKSSALHNLFKQADKLRATTDAEFTKEPIVELAACKNLLRKMDKTEDRLYNLIGTTLVTLPAALEKNPKDE